MNTHEEKGKLFSTSKRTRLIYTRHYITGDQTWVYSYDKKIKMQFFEYRFQNFNFLFTSDCSSWTHAMRHHGYQEVLYRNLHESVRYQNCDITNLGSSITITHRPTLYYSYSSYYKKLNKCFALTLTLTGPSFLQLLSILKTIVKFRRGRGTKSRTL